MPEPAEPTVECDACEGTGVIPPWAKKYLEDSPPGAHWAVDTKPCKPCDGTGRRKLADIVEKALVGSVLLVCNHCSTTFHDARARPRCQQCGSLNVVPTGKS